MQQSDLVHDSLVIGAGQGGLSTSHHLVRLGVEHVVLDADGAPGGAWQHRWDSLSMTDVHGVADLPDSPAPAVVADPANVVVPAWFADYERTHGLPVLRPVRVTEVTDDGGLLVVRAGERQWRTRTLVNATGTWTSPFVPRYPGADTFAGEQLHTRDYPGASTCAGAGCWWSGAGRPPCSSWGSWPRSPRRSG